MGFIPQAQPHAQSLFLFPIVFGINLIHFFDFFDDKEERCSRKFDRLLCCFDRLSITPCDSSKNANCFEKCNVLATESVNLAPFKRGKTEVQFFWQGKAQNSSPILRCTFLARRSANLIANFSATMVTSLPSFSLSLCLYLSLSHRMYLTHNIGSASALPIIHSTQLNCENNLYSTLLRRGSERLWNFKVLNFEKKKKKKKGRFWTRANLNRGPLAKETLVYPSELCTTRRLEAEREYYSTDVRSRIVVVFDQTLQFLFFLAEKKPLRRCLGENAKGNSTLVLSLNCKFAIATSNSGTIVYVEMFDCFYKATTSLHGLSFE